MYIYTYIYIIEQTKPRSSDSRFRRKLSATHNICGLGHSVCV